MITLFIFLIVYIRYIYSSHWIYKFLYWIFIIAFLYYYLNNCEKVLAEEKDNVGLNEKIVFFDIKIVEYISEINLSIEDKDLFYSMIQKNKTTIFKVLETLETVEAIQNYAKFVIDNALNHRKVRDAWVFYSLQQIFFLYLGYLRYMDII